MKKLIHRIRRWWYMKFPQYETVEGRCTTYETADRLIRETSNLEDPHRWDIWPEMEDKNRVIGVAFIRKRKRITVSEPVNNL